MTISINSIETIDLNKNVVASKILGDCQKIKFILINNANNQTVYLTKGPFTDIINDSSWFEILGSPIIKASDKKTEFDIPDGDSSDLSLDSKLIQSTSQALEIGQNISKNFFYKRVSYEIEIFGNPYVQVGDIVNFTYNYGKININTPNKKYLVISVNHNFSSGLTTTIKIRPLEK
jgi:hypothetical protein